MSSHIGMIIALMHVSIDCSFICDVQSIIHQGFSNLLCVCLEILKCQFEISMVTSWQLWIFTTVFVATLKNGQPLEENMWSTFHERAFLGAFEKWISGAFGAHNLK